MGRGVPSGGRNGDATVTLSRGLLLPVDAETVAMQQAKRQEQEALRGELYAQAEADRNRKNGEKAQRKQEERREEERVIHERDNIQKQFEEEEQVAKRKKEEAFQNELKITS